MQHSEAFSSSFSLNILEQIDQGASTGGVAIVPDPDSARFSAMPRSALACVTVDYTVPLSGIAPLLVRLVAFDD